MTDLPAPKGHNKPPSDLEILQSRIELAYISLFQEADKHILFAKKIPAKFSEDSEANFVSDYIKKIQVCQKNLEKCRKEEKEPFLRQGKFIDSFFGELSNSLEEAVRGASKPLNDYLQAKANAEKIEREKEAAALRAEQQRAFEAVQAMTPVSAQSPVTAAQDQAKAVEHLVTMSNVTAVADKLAAVPEHTLAKVTGSVSNAALKKVWQGKITNKAELDLEKLRPYLTEAVLQVAVNAFVKTGGRILAGAEIKETIDVSVR